MPRPSRARRILKWTLTGVSLLILTAWPISIKNSFFVTLGRHSALGLSGGAVVATLFADFDIIHGIVTPNTLVPNERMDLGLQLPLVIDRNPVYVIPNTANYDTLIVIPFWLPLLLTAIPTAWLWHRDRRRIRPGCCLRCGYDLTGNTSGVCPECGDKVHSPVVLADTEYNLFATGSNENSVQ